MTANPSDFEPVYLSLHRSGELKARGQHLWDSMKCCRLCPRDCQQNRLKGKKGICEASSVLKISSFHPHFGEEAPLSGTRGSGTIFFTHCSLRCVFCINREISIGGIGNVQDIRELAQMMLKLQELGCHNINVVTPTHYSPHIVLALDIAAAEGLRLPLVYNTSGYERIEVLRLLEGIVDIYLPDVKYMDAGMAALYSEDAKDYPEIVRAALLEMNRQVGVAEPGTDGLIRRGLMIRHLVMPNGISSSDKVISWIAGNFPRNTYVNLMSQYHPVGPARNISEIDRPLLRNEYDQLIRLAKKKGLSGLEIQGF